MKLGVKFYSALSEEENPRGIPGNWPYETLTFKDSDTVPDGYTEMTLVEYTQYKADHQSEYDEWLVSHPPIPPMKLIAHIGSRVVGAEKIVTETDWVVLGGVVSTPSFFSPHIENMFGRFVGSYKLDIGTAYFRAIQRDLATDNEDIVMSGELPLTTDNKYTIFGFNTDRVAKVGTYEYELQTKTTSESTLCIRYATITLLEILFI